MTTKKLLWLAIVVGVVALGASCPPPEAQASQIKKSPFTDTIGENFHLVYCDDATDKIIALGKRRMELISLYNSDMATPILKQMLEEKINAIPPMIIQIHMWMTDHCSEA